MGKYRGIRYVVAALVLFLFTSGFLGFCVGPNYKPCSIKFLDPVNGTVLAPGTTSVVISGKVVAGDKAPSVLVVLNSKGGIASSVPFSKTTGEFTYKALLNAKLYTTVTFEVKDTNFIANKERISLAVGESSTPGDAGVVDDAVRLMLNEDFMNQVEVIGAEFINNWKNDLIYGWNSTPYGSHNASSPFVGKTPLLPIYYDLGTGMGELEINPARTDIDSKGFANLGAVSIGIDIKPGGVISATLFISQAAGVNPNGSSKAIYVQGRHNAWLLGNPHFMLMADGVTITNAKLKMSVNSENKIVASLDLNNANLSFSNLYAEYGILDFPDWLLNLIIGLVKDQILGMLALSIPIVDANNIVLPPFSGIQAGGWPMNTSTIFTSTENDLTVDLGVSAKLADGITPLVPGLTKFYATPGDPLPTLAIIGDENIQLALTDDIVNNLAFVAIQAGLVNDIDVTADFKTQLKKLSLKDLVAKASLDTPPIIDFSGMPLNGTLAVNDFGRVIIRNLNIDISFKTAIPPYPIAMRLSADVNAALQLDISDDGKHITGGIDVTQSDASITICYDNLGNAAFAPTIGKDIANTVINEALKSMLNIEVPSLPLYGSTVNIALLGSELNSNSLIAKVKITN
jgi:hypothetical protein